MTFRSTAARVGAAGGRLSHPLAPIKEQHMPTNPQPTRYRQRPNEVDAIQWTGHNADALRAFAGIDFATIDPADRVDDPDCDAQLLVEASHWVAIKPTDWVLKFEGYFIAKDDVPFRAVWEPASTAPLAVGLPARLEAALTERFTELGNPFSAMHRQEKGPDGWPASYPVGPHHVAEVLRELLAAAPASGPSRAADEAQQPETQAQCPGFERQPNRCSCGCEGCRHNCAAHQPAAVSQPDDGPPAPLRRAWDDCPGFPEKCPNLRPVDPDPPTHLGGIRCGCAGKESTS